jgi:hypothetical protein
MNDVNISDLSAFVAIDRTADLIEQYDVSAGTNNRMTPNQMLGITGVPLGTTDSQTVSNKILGNSNTVTLKGSLFTLQDASDTTKQAVFSMAGITTATTRTYTLPNANVTIADTSSAQTFTNKTLTSPTINTATINNPTLNTDAVNEFTADHGVTVDGLNIHNGALNTNNSVVTANITDGAVTPAKLQSGTGSGWAWSAWSPTLANLTPGNGTQTARYIQIGKTVFFNWIFIFGSTSSVGTGPTVTFPVAAASYYSTNDKVGTGSWLSVGGTLDGFLSANVQSTTVFAPVVWGAAATYVGPLTGITAAVPGTWGVNSYLRLTGMYEAA